MGNMQLISITLQGYKRFERPSKMNVDGKLIALVGPNEAGKTSLLDSLPHLNRINRPSLVASGGSRELTRGAAVSDSRNIVGAWFLLDDADKEAISHLDVAGSVRWFYLGKRTNNQLYAEMSPKVLRNLQRRKEAVRTLAEDWPMKILVFRSDGDEDASDSSKNFVDLMQLLDVDDANLPDETIERTRSFVEVLESEEDSRYIELGFDLERIRQLVQQFKELIEYESDKDLSQSVISVLFQRKPEFLLFDNDARLLQSDYDLDEHGDNPPAALRNLARVAQLDLAALRRARAEGELGQVEFLMEKANHQLSIVFANTWSQSGITVRLRSDEGVLHIFVGSTETSYVSIAERSDGLRQFVALLAFTTLEHTEQAPPILLIDEAEVHLHYDAQADLIQMFARQEVASKIIYTTHSVGCLPEDLGTGVRMIEPNSLKTSTIRNAFWDDARPGFTPLLFGMGASTLAFVSLRYALAVEGISDVILLPTLLREATSLPYLGFQVVPGLSGASEHGIGLLERGAPRTAYLVDSDTGGDKIRNKLRRAGIPDNRVFRLLNGEAQQVVLEDFVDPDAYVDAVNKELHRSHGESESFPSDELPDVGRPEAVKAWCASKGIGAPNKRAIAYHIVDSRSSRSVMSEAYRDSLRQLHTEIVAVLQEANS